MTTSARASLADLARQSLAGLRVMLVLTVVLGIGYPVAVWAVGRVVAPDRAAGQPVRVDGVVVGSALLAQASDGDRWFHPRPSAGGHDTLASGPSNLGPRSEELAASIEERRAEVAATEGVAEERVPPDAVTASASGLDPHVSPAYAALQAPRVATANGLPLAEVRRLVDAHTEGRVLGFLGEPGVNVLELNVAVREAREGAGAQSAP